MDTQSTILITCPKGLGPYLSKEIAELGFSDILETPAGIQTKGTLTDTMRLNLCVRTGHHVLYHMASFPCGSIEQLYENIRSISWENYIEADGYISITSSVDHPSIRNWQFANLKTKDAIVDRINEKKGRRPDSGNQTTRTVIFIYWKHNNCSVYLDTSGTPLSKRAYRKIPMDAPLQETLAAGLLIAAGYDGTQDIINPMCGAGTLAIEAVLIALKAPPGMFRDNFGFMHIKGFDRKKWLTLRKEVLSRLKKQPAAKCIATDIDARAIQAARTNARLAGVERFIHFDVCPFEYTRLPDSFDTDAGQKKGIIILNPPYGQRLDDEQKLMPVYKKIGDWLKQKCTGWKGYIFSGNLRLLKQIGLKADSKLDFYNGRIPCRLHGYTIFSS